MKIHIQQVNLHDKSEPTKFRKNKKTTTFLKQMY